MKLEYEQVEESFDDTTHLRTITEQARVRIRCHEDPSSFTQST